MIKRGRSRENEALLHGGMAFIRAEKLHKTQLHPLERSSFLCSMMPRAGWRARSIPALAGTQLFPRPPHLNRAR